MKKTAAVVGILCVLTGALFATEARIEGLGKTNVFFRDVTEIYYNPALLYNHVNSVEGEFGTYTGSAPMDSWAGFNHQLTEAIYWGIAAQRKEGEIGHLSGLELYPHNGLNILLNYKMEALSFGLGLYKSGNKSLEKSVNEEGDVVSETETSVGVLGFRVGGVFETYNESVFEGAVAINMNSYKNEQTVGDETETNELDGGLGIDLKLRGFMPMFGEGTKFVPAFSLNTFSYKSKYENSANPDLNTTSGSISDMSMSLSAGLNHEVYGAMIAGGLSFDYITHKDESDTTRTITKTEIHLPRVNLGVEKELSDHFTGRFGLQKIMGTITTKDEDSDGAYDEVTSIAAEDVYDENFISAGLSAVFGDLSIDMALETDALFNGGYIFSGVPASLNYKLSVLYTF